RPLRATLVPYTTLFRSSGEEESGESNAPRLTPVFVPLPAAPREPSPEESASQAYSEALDRALPDDVSSEDQAAATRYAQATDERSEEHTSELQSRENLV